MLYLFLLLTFALFFRLYNSSEASPSPSTAGSPSRRSSTASPTRLLASSSSTKSASSFSHLTSTSFARSEALRPSSQFASGATPRAARVSSTCTAKPKPTRTPSASYLFLHLRFTPTTWRHSSLRAERLACRRESAELIVALSTTSSTLV